MLPPTAAEMGPGPRPSRSADTQVALVQLLVGGVDAAAEDAAAASMERWLATLPPSRANGTRAACGGNGALHCTVDAVEAWGDGIPAPPQPLHYALYKLTWAGEADGDSGDPWAWDWTHGQAVSAAEPRWPSLRGLSRRLLQRLQAMTLAA